MGAAFFFFDTSTFFSFQENFPTLEERPYPTWISFVIFVLAGIPTLAIPFTAVFKFFQNRCGKKDEDYGKTGLPTISSTVEMSDKA